MEEKYKSIINNLYDDYVDLTIKSNKYRQEGNNRKAIEKILKVEYDAISKLSIEASTRCIEIIKMINKTHNLDFVVEVDKNNGDILIFSGNEYTEILQSYSYIIDKFFKAEFDIIKSGPFLKIFSTFILYENDTIHTMLDMDDDSIELYIRLNKEKIWKD